jgi:hypothetical protein
MRYSCVAVVAVFAVAGCAMSSGIIVNGPNTYTVSEMRAAARGGLPEAQRVALGEANAFCQQQSRVFVPLAMAPGGDPYSVYGPTVFTTTFRCLAPNDPAVAEFRAGQPSF